MSNTEYFKYDILLHKAAGLKAEDLKVREWRLIHSSDPFVTFKCNGELLWKSETKTEQLNPVWNEHFSIKLPSDKNVLLVEVWDYDKHSANDLIGCTQISLNQIEPGNVREFQDVLRSSLAKQRKDKNGRIFFSIKRENLGEIEEDTISRERVFNQIVESTVIVRIIEIKELRESIINGEWREKVLYSVKIKIGKKEFQTKKVKRLRRALGRHNDVVARFHEEFIFQLHLESDAIIEKDQIIYFEFIETTYGSVKGQKQTTGRYRLEISKFEKDRVHDCTAIFENEDEMISKMDYRITINGTNTAQCRKDEFEKAIKRNEFATSKTLQEISKVGILSVTVHNATNLPIADIAGKSDPYCFINLGKTRFRTSTIEQNLNPEWNRTFYFDIEDLYHNLVISVYDQDESGKDDFLGRLCLPLQQIEDGKQNEYKLKNKNCENFCEKGSITITCVRHVNYYRGNFKILYPMSEDSMPFERNYTISTLFKNLDRLKAFEPKSARMWIGYYSEVLEWTYPITTLAWLVIYILFVLYFELWWIPLIIIIILVIGKTDPKFFRIEYADRVRRTSKTVGHPRTPGRTNSTNDFDEEEKKSSYIQDSQIYIEAFCGVLEKLYHIYRWVQPQITLTIVVCLTGIMLGLMIIPLRYLVLFWGIKKFSNALNTRRVKNEEILNILSRMHTIPDLKRYEQRILNDN